jgi:hypothetical protein
LFGQKAVDYLKICYLCGVVDWVLWVDQIFEYLVKGDENLVVVSVLLEELL